MAYEIRGSLWGTLCHDVREPLAGLELRAYRSTGDRTTEQAVADDKETFHEVAERRTDGGSDRRRPRRGVRGVRPDDRRQGVRRRSARPRPVRREAAAAAARPGREASPVRRDDAAASLAPDEEEHSRGVGVRDPEPVLVPHPGAVRHLDHQRPDHDVRRQVPDPGCGRLGLRRRLAAGRPARHGDHGRDRPLPDQLPRVGLPAHTVLAVPQRRADGGPGRLRQGGARRQPIITETQADGRKPGRQNVGHCFCLDLCTDKVVVGDPETVPHWQQVEVFDIHPATVMPGSTFDTLGYADTAGGAYVFGGSVTLRGNCPLTEHRHGQPAEVPVPGGRVHLDRRRRRIPRTRRRSPRRA